MAAVRIRVPKPKMTMSAVQGKISVFAEDGERIGQWGGTECFLSRQSGLGPCLVVRSSRHKKHEGTFFQLIRLQRVVSTRVAEGHLTVMVPHEQRQCSVFIDTTEDLDELRMMAGVLQDKARWKDMERNVASRSRNGPLCGGKGDGGGRGSAELRDPSLAQLSGRGAEDDDDDSYGEEMKVTHYDGSAAAGSAVQGCSLAGPSAVASPTPVTSSQSSAPQRSTMVAGSSNRSGPITSITAAQQQQRSWTNEQHRAMQLVRAGYNVFVSGAAGTGKTEWLLHVLQHVLPRTRQRRGVKGGADPGAAEEEEENAVDTGRVTVTAATGIAARLIGGKTVHSFSGIGRGEGDLDAILQRVQNKPDVVRAWQRCEVLVIDEISMLSSHTFAQLDRIARALRASMPSPASPSPRRHQTNNATLPFGGIQLLVVGDFLQLPPVSRGAGEEMQPAFMAAVWRSCEFQSIIFTKDYRHAEDPRFAECCAAVRRGECTPLVREVLEACLGRELEERFGVEATTLLARRKDVDRYNAERLRQLESMQFQRYASEDYAAVPGANIDDDVSLPSVLTLKVGAQVVLLASLPNEPSLANGNLGVVVGFVAQTHGPALPLVRFSTGVEAMVPAVTMEVYGRDGRLSMSRRQVPLQLAWALTVHRVQGMTLPMIRLALDKSFFEAGQAYVALSRVRKAEDLSLTALDLDVVAARVSTEARDFYGLSTTTSARSSQTAVKRVSTSPNIESAPLLQSDAACAKRAFGADGASGDGAPFSPTGVEGGSSVDVPWKRPKREEV
ncbi:hypothetical protein GH5_05821 [Leishmania sp. Ghana 2012 LV757]|uniref:hypothetical protein n=1 Tax=Leishmania sp. Ghana 2012 LV757 TaxID=2803181 RepID=UPI001B59EE0A|nr:hypothetical protein GH5_05821 [Leishmania sp. Ghana 2012 LV757]